VTQSARLNSILYAILFHVVVAALTRVRVSRDVLSRAKTRSYRIENHLAVECVKRNGQISTRTIAFHVQLVDGCINRRSSIPVGY
jgi:hypothetical protein